MSVASENLFDTIEAYLAERLSLQEKKDFEARLLIDTNLLNEVERHRKLHTYLQDKERIALRKELKNIHQEITSGLVKKQKQQIVYRMVAAIALLITAGSLAWFLLSGPSSMPELYAAYYEPYPVAKTMRTDTVDTDTTFARYYAKHEYDRVVTEAISVSKPLTDLQRLYVAISYLETGKPEKARTVLQTITQSSTYYEDCLWYQALSFLKENNRKGVREMLSILIKYDGKYGEKAKEVSKELALN